MKVVFIIVYLTVMFMAYHWMYTDISERFQVLDCITDMECMELNPQLGDY